MKYTVRHFLEYPKLLCLLLSCVLAYFLFQQGAFALLVQGINGNEYLFCFLAGLLFSFGFTSPFAFGIFVEMAGRTHPIPAALIGGVGAFLADISIFEFVRFSMYDELHKLKATALFQHIRAFVFHEGLSERVRLYLLWSIVGIAIASPLPDEIGVTLISGATNIDSKKFSVLCFTMNTIGILVILMGARALT